MNYLWEIIRNTMTIVGGFLVYCGVSTSDYYVIELGQPEPQIVWTTIYIGLTLMIPTVIHLICKKLKEKKQ